MPFLLLYIYIYIPPRYIVAPRLTVAAVYMDLFQFYFIPEINRLSTRFVERNVVSLLPPNPGREKGKTWIKNWGEREGEKSSRPVPSRSVTFTFPVPFTFLVDSIIHSWSGELFDERRNSLESIIQPPRTRHSLPL